MTRPRAAAGMVLALIAGAGGLPARADVAEALVDLKAGRFLEAAAELQSVVDRSPGYAYGHFLLGHCKLKTRDIAGAEYEFRRALNLDPARADYYLGFGLALSAGGKWPFSIRAASEGLIRTSDPRVRSALLALRAYGWGALQRWSDAVDDLEALQRIRPQPWALQFLGKARFAKGDYAGAVAPLRQTLFTLPDDPVVLRLLAECFIRLAADETDAVRKRFNYKQALAYAQQVASGLPGDLSAMQLVGRAALGAGMLEQAENVFRHVLSIDQRQCYAMADLGRTYMAAARWSEAETYLLKASVCAPRLATVHESLGDVYVALGKPEEAAAEYLRADQSGAMRGSSDLPDTVPVFAPR